MLHDELFLKEGKSEASVASLPAHLLTFAAKVFNDWLAVLRERVQAFLDSLLVIVHSSRCLCSVKQTVRHSSGTDVEVQDYAAFSNL